MGKCMRKRLSTLLPLFQPEGGVPSFSVAPSFIGLSPFTASHSSPSPFASALLQSRFLVPETSCKLFAGAHFLSHFFFS